LSSKTRYLAAQFEAYLQGDLWREIAGHATSEARYLAEQLKQFPQITMIHPVQSNAIFPCLPEAWIKPLLKESFFYIWDHDRNMARWMISWDWQRADTDRLLGKIQEVARQWPQ
jgi:threonine aldolase